MPCERCLGVSRKVLPTRTLLRKVRGRFQGALFPPPSKKHHDDGGLEGCRKVVPLKSLLGKVFGRLQESDSRKALWSK
eukprot:7419482-Pyramimonas_sp.AAC.1